MTESLRKSLYLAFKAVPSDWESYFSFDTETNEIQLRFNEDYSRWLPQTNFTYCNVPELINLVIGSYNNGYSIKD